MRIVLDSVVVSPVTSSGCKLRNAQGYSKSAQGRLQNDGIRSLMLFEIGPSQNSFCNGFLGIKQIQPVAGGLDLRALDEHLDRDFGVGGESGLGINDFAQVIRRREHPPHYRLVLGGRKSTRLNSSHL